MPAVTPIATKMLQRRECPLCAKSRHDRPHSSTLAPKQEKRIRLRPPIVIDPPIVAAPRHSASLDVPMAPGKKEAVVVPDVVARNEGIGLSLIHISEPTRLGMISYAVFCLKKKK